MMKHRLCSHPSPDVTNSRIIHAIVLSLAAFGALTLLGSCASLRFSLPDMASLDKRLMIRSCKDPEDCHTRILRPDDADFVKSSELPKYVVGAIIVSEDATFFTHHGIDWYEVRKAIALNIRERRYVRGASTITQQVVKNAFLSSEKSLARKAVEAIIAIRMEQTLSKQQILDYYLNLVPLGPGIIGLQEGSKFYFNKSPQDLTPHQAALLAYFIPRPSHYGMLFATGKPSRHRKTSVRRILKRMVRQHYLDPRMVGSNIEMGN